MLPAALVSLFRTRLFLEEGRSQYALGVLENVQSHEQEVLDEVTYLQGWCFIQQGYWDDAMKVLSPFLIEERHQEPDLEPLPDREQHIITLLHLGQVAARLAHYDDALIHFTRCLKLLRDRRVHLPHVCIRAHVLLAVTHVIKRSCSNAIHQYEEARRLSTLYSIDEELPTIYYGLCEAKRGLARFSEAYRHGKEALHLYQAQGNELLQARVHNVLGTISTQLSYLDEADEHFTQALRLAEERQQPVMVLLNYAGLAALRLKQQQFDEVSRYSKYVLAYTRQQDDSFMAGEAYLSVAKVTLDMSDIVPDTQRQTLQNGAIELFQRSEQCLKEVQAYVTLADLYERWARFLESVGRDREAINCWRSAYDMMHMTKAVECPTVECQTV